MHKSPAYDTAADFLSLSLCVIAQEFPFILYIVANSDEKFLTLLDEYKYEKVVALIFDPHFVCASQKWIWNLLHIKQTFDFFFIQSSDKQVSFKTNDLSQ